MSEREVEDESREKSGRILAAMYVCEKSGAKYIM